MSGPMKSLRQYIQTIPAGVSRFIDKEPLLAIFAAVFIAGIGIAALSLDEQLAVGLVIFGLIPVIPLLYLFALLQKASPITHLWNKWWARILVALLVVLILELGGSWAQGVITEAYNTPPSSAALTQVALTLLYVPGVMLGTVFAKLWIPGICLAALVMFWRVWKGAGWHIELPRFAAIVISLAFLMEDDGKIKTDAVPLALTIGYRLDFHDQNPCSDVTMAAGERAMMLDPDHVLIESFVPNGEGTKAVLRRATCAPKSDTR